MVLIVSTVRVAGHVVTAVTCNRTAPSRGRGSEAVRADHPHLLRHTFGQRRLTPNPGFLNWLLPSSLVETVPLGPPRAIEHPRDATARSVRALAHVNASGDARVPSDIEHLHTCS